MASLGPSPCRASLTGALFRSLALVQTIVFVAVAWAYVAFTAELSPNGLGHDRAASILADAAVAGGLDRIVLTPDLEAYLRGRDALRYGVAMGDLWLDGSTLTLDLGDGVTLSDTRFALRGAAPIEGLATLAKADGATLLVATAGNSPDLLDVVWYSGHLLQRVALLMGPILAGSLLITWLRLRRGIAPLGALARAAAAIDLDTPTPRSLDASGVPVELAPLAEAFNVALGRLGASFVARRRFLDNAAHELRTPLAVLRARVDAMLPGEDRTLLQRDARRLGALADQLLASARLHSGLAPAPVPVNLHALLRDLVADYAPLAHALSLDLAVVGTADAAGPVVQGHPTALTAAFANLLDNALRVEPSGGCVEVRLDGLRVAVADHGPGLDSGSVALAFEPFWRAGEERKGSGLGLAIVAEIVRAHGATIGVEPTPNGGASFVVTFPAPPPERSLVPMRLRPA